MSDKLSRFIAFLLPFYNLHLQFVVKKIEITISNSKQRKKDKIDEIFGEKQVKILTEINRLKNILTG